MLVAVLIAGVLEGSPVALVEQVSRATTQERDIQVRLGIAWIKRGRTWDVSNPAAPELKKDEEFMVWRTSDGVRQMLIRKNGKPASGKAKPPDTDVGTLEPDRYGYRWNAVPEQEFDGHPCWVLDFSPLDPLPQMGSIQEEIALRLTGTIWIDRERLFVRHVQGKLSAPFRRKLFGALLISDTRAVMTNRTLGDRIVPDRAEMTVYHSLVGVGSAVRTEFDYSGFQSGFVPPSP